MFEGWATDLLASYLGKLLDIQQEQLKVNLWTAWKTGVTLEDVPLREDVALDQFGTIPFTLVGGTIGKVQVSVPWGALMAPVVVSLNDVAIVVRMLGDDELSGRKAYERYIDFKKGLIASQQLKAVAWEVDKASPSSSKDGSPLMFGGVMFSFLKHALSLLLGRLRVDIRNVRITLVDGEEGSAPICTFSVGQIQSIDTPLTFKLDKKDAYRIPGREDTIVDLADRSLKLGASKNFRFSGIKVMWGAASCLLHTDFNAKIFYDIKSTPSQILFTLEFDTLKSHMNTDELQAMVELMEDVEWKSVRLKVGHLKPQDGAFDASRRWKFAVNSILLQLYGPLKFSSWKSPKERLQERRRYILLYRKKIEKEVREGLTKSDLVGSSDVGVSQSLSLVGENQLALLEESMSVSDILACRTAAKRSLDHRGSQLVGKSSDSTKIGNYELVDNLSGEDTSESCWVKIPSLADMEELFKAVDFSPEESVAEQSSSGLNIQTLVMVHIPTSQVEICNNAGTVDVCVKLANIACGFVSALEKASYGMGSLESLSCSSPNGSFVNSVVNDSLSFVKLEYSSLTKCIQADISGIQIKAVPQDIQGIFHSIPVQSPEAYSLQWMRSALSMEKIGYCVETVQRIKSLGNFIDFAIRLGETTVDVHDLQTSFNSLTLGTLMESENFDELHRVYNVISSLRPQEEASRVVQDAMQALEHRLIYKALDIQVESLAVYHHKFIVLNPVSFGVSTKINRLLGDFSHPQVILGISLTSIDLQANDEVIRTLMYIADEFTQTNDGVPRENVPEDTLEVRVDWSSMQVGWFDDHKQFSVQTEAGMVSSQTSMSTSVFQTKINSIEMEHLRGMQNIEMPVFDLCIPYIAKVLHIGHFTGTAERSKRSRSASLKLYDFNLTGADSDPSNFIKRLGPEKKTPGVAVTYTEDFDGRSCVQGELSNIDIGHGVILRASLLPLVLSANTNSIVPEDDKQDKACPVSFQISLHNLSLAFVHDSQSNVRNMPIDYLDFSSVQPRIASCSINRLQLGITLSEKPSVDSFEMEALKLRCGILSNRGPLLTPILDIPVVNYCLQDNNVLVVKCRQIEVGIHPYQLTLLRALALRWECQKESLSQSYASKHESSPDSTDTSLALPQMDFSPVEVQIQDIDVSLLGLPSLNGGVLVVGRSCSARMQPKSFRFCWNRLEILFKESQVAQVDPSGSNDESRSMAASNSTSPCQTDFSHSSDLDNHTEFYDVSRNASSASFVSKYYSIGDDETTSVSSQSLVEEGDSASTLNVESLTSVVTIAFDQENQEQQGVEVSLSGKSAKVSISPIYIAFCIDPIASIVHFVEAYGNYLSTHVCVEDVHQSSVILRERAPRVRDLEVELQCVSLMMETKHRRGSIAEQLSSSIDSTEDSSCCTSEATKDFLSVRLNKGLCSYSSGKAGQKISLRVLGILFAGDSSSEGEQKENWQSSAIVGVQNLNIQCSILHKKKEAQAFKSDASCDQISVWINQENVPPVQHVILRLRDCMDEARATSHSNRGSQMTQSWSSNMINSTIMMSLGRFSIVLASSIADEQVYLMEGNLKDISVMAYFINRVAHGSASCSIGVAVPIVQYGVWANVLDDTVVKFQAISPHLDQTSNPSPGSKIAHLDLDVGSANLTITSDILHSISLCEAFVTSLITSQNQIDFEVNTGMDWVVNHTEFDILLCFPGDNEACSHAGAIVLEPGAKYYPSQISTQPYKSGLPDIEQGISERGECNNISRCPSPDFMDVKLSGSDSRYCRIDLQRDRCSRHSFNVEGQSLAVISKTKRLPSGAWRTSLEPSIEFQNNTVFRITLRYISDHSPEYPLIRVVPQNAKIWLPLSAVSGEYRFKIDTQETMLTETEKIDDISPIGLSEPLFMWDSMFQTEYSDQLDIISDHETAQFCMSLTIKGISGSISFIASPKVLLQNLLPVPMTVVSEDLCTRLCASPTETLMLTDVHHLPWNFKISPVDFNESPMFCLSDTEGTSRISCIGDPEQTSMLSTIFSDNSSGNTELFAQLITHRSSDTGTVLLKIVAPIWVYNYTGLPISLSCLLSSEVANEIDKWEEPDDGEIMDIVPESWILPLQISVGAELISVRSVPSSLHMSLSEPSICETERGGHDTLDHMLGRQRYTEQNVSEASTDIFLGLGCLAHDAEGVEDASLIHHPHGQANAVDSPSGRMPKAHSAWPSGLNQFAVSLLKQPMKKIRIRSSKQKARSGSTFWSSPLFLGGLHDRHEIVQIPTPVSTGGMSKDNFRPGEYPAVVSLKVLEEGVEEIIISPQFVIINQLTSSIQYRQKGTNAEVKIKPGEYSPLQWTDSGLPRKLSVRILEAGWLWSGGFSLEHAGDIFLKLRHRDRGITRIVRADVSHSLKDGTRRIIFRSNPDDFTPYRIENCSLETLIIRQKGVMDQQDVLRPYCSLDYTWDEPSLSHFVVIERPGGLFVGSIDLDRVGLKFQVNVKDKMSDKKVRLSISVHSEGPMRVLRVMDEKYHQSISHNGNDLIRVEGLNNTFDLKCTFNSIFISYVQKREEKLLLAIRYFALSCLTSPSRISISGSIDLIQVDNPRITSIFPVVLVLPAPESSLTSRVRKGIEPQNVKKPLAWNLIVWRKKPQNKVVCFELAEIHLKSLGIYIEQDILNLFENISEELESLQRLNIPHSKGFQTRNGKISSLDLSTLEFSKTKQYRDDKYYFDRIIISPVEVRLSFNSSLVQDSSRAFFQQVIALADIEDARLWLAGVILKNALLDEITMQSFLSSHYRRALLLELFKIVGAANVLGDPMALLHHVGLGVWEFFSGPAVGLIESARTFGPREFIFGFISGTKGLLQNVLFAASNATTKASSAAHKAILLWGFGRDDRQNDLPMNTVMQHWVRVDEHLPDEEGLIGAILRGLVGLATDPIKGAEERGLLGFVDGVFHGLLGTILIPLSAWLQMCASTARSIRKAVAGTANLSWTRPPRWIDLSKALEPYSRTESMGRWLFVQLSMLQYWRKKIENDSFVVCCRLYNAEKSDESYLLLTDRRVLVVTAKGNNWNPRVLWTSRLGAIETIHTDQKSVLIIANPELVKSSMLRMHEEQGKLFSVFIARLETESESQKFSAELTYECSKYLRDYYSNRIGFNI